ncbi:MAG: sensor domain-containing protein, partial [Rhodoferax sp.]
YFVGTGTDIGERKRVEKGLHLTQFSVDAASDLMFWVTPDARIVDVNAAACRALGYTREELLQLHVSDVDTHYNAALWPEHFVQIRQHGSMMFESELRAGDGRLFPVEVVANYIEHDGEERSCAFIRDISERKRVEKGLHLTQFSVDAASDAMFWITPDARIVAVNAAACRSLGYTREELLLLRIPDVDPHYNAEIWPGHFAQLRQLGSLTFESEHRRKDGELFAVEIVANFIAHDGEDLNCAFIRDITKRKQAEAKIQLAAGVFSNAREAIMITDVQGTILDVNEAFTRITGYLRDDVIGNNPRILGSGRQDKAFYAAMWRELLANGHWVGELWNCRKDGGVFIEMLTISAVRDSHGNILQYVALFSDITAIKEHQRKLEHIAHFDALTDLPNRVLLADRLQQAMVQAQRRGQQLAVVYLDLDGFKAINDKHGHGAGDQILMTLAKRMKQALREADTLARLGGDEFVAVLGDLEDVTASAPLLTRLLAAAAQPVSVDGLSLQVSASLGVTFYPQAQDVDADQLLRQADHAMYQAKVTGKNRYLVFDAVQDSSLRVHHESLENIRLALERGEFVLYYQPKVNMCSGQVIGAEALIRWQHPAKGLLAPAAFLPVIEDHPLSVAVGEWVIDTALTQVELWRASGLDIPVSVNIGARQLQQFNFVERLQAMLAAHPQVAPDRLELEVLETSALEDITQVSQVIDACAAIGVIFALDDFGTGYSSLTYLKRLRVALLKIDQSFVRDMLDDPHDLAILQGVIGLATAFRRQVIAEGVETVAHGTLLLQLGCDLAQGYGIARPMPADQLPDWAQAWRPDPSWSGHA